MIGFLKRCKHRHTHLQTFICNIHHAGTTLEPDKKTCDIYGCVKCNKRIKIGDYRFMTKTQKQQIKMILKNELLTKEVKTQ